MYKHVLWDFDGTLFDTYPVMGGTFCELLKEAGIDEPLEAVLQNMKVSMLYAIQFYNNKYNLNDVFLEKYKERNSEAELQLCRPYAGIEDILRYIHASGKNNYLYTHRGDSSITLLRKFGLYDYFTDFITSRQGFQRKPCPDAINYLTQKHHMMHREAIMIGDRDLDIQSAKNAGIDACFFYDSTEIKDIKAIHHIDDIKITTDYIISDFTQLYRIL